MTREESVVLMMEIADDARRVCSEKLCKDKPVDARAQASVMLALTLMRTSDESYLQRERLVTRMPLP